MKKHLLMMTMACAGLVCALGAVGANAAWAETLAGDDDGVQWTNKDGNHAVVEVECGDFFEYPQLTAFDACDGDLTGDIVIGGDEVDPNVVGEYLVTYNVTDLSGNPAEEATRTIVVYDEAPPAITVFGNNPVGVLVGEAYEDDGATAFDACDGDLTAEMIVNNPVDTSTVGDYIVTYSVQDYSNNSAEETRQVYVREALLEVVLLEDIALMEGESFEWHGVTANEAGMATFQWYRYDGYDYTPVVNGPFDDGAYAGAETDTLQFVSFTAAMAGEYMLEVSDDITTTQKTATVTLEEEAELPATSLFGLAIAVAAVAAAGAIVMKRRHG